VAMGSMFFLTGEIVIQYDDSIQSLGCTEVSFRL